MIRFKIFNIPVTIQPWHWLGLAFLGGAFYLDKSSDVILVLLFMLAGFFNVLSHELGHALVGRRYGGGDAEITLILLGGYTVHYSNHYRTPLGKRAMLFAGCAMNLLTVLLCTLITVLLLRNNLEVCSTVLKLMIQSPSGAGNIYVITHPETLNTLNSSTMFQTLLPYYFLGCLFWTAFWWGLINLVPVFPMDGGQLLDTFVRSHKTTHKVGMVLSSIGMIIGFYYGWYILAIFMMFFAYDNYGRMQKTRF